MRTAMQGAFALALLLAPLSLQAQTVEYLYDDGDGDTNQGPPSSFDPDMLWGNYFLTQTGGEVITQISVAFGPTFPSLEDGPVTFWLLDDPDADFDPRNATAVASVQATPDVVNDAFFTVEIEPTLVSGAFFVGASALLQGGEDRPARVDRNAAGDRSWFFYAPDIAATIDDLASAPFGTRMDNPEFVIFPGAFMIRAEGESAPVANEEEGATPRLALAVPYPNPTASGTTLTYDLVTAGSVSLTVYDVLGRPVATLVDGVRPAGRHEVRWDAGTLAPGRYTVRLLAGADTQTRALTVLR